MKRIILTVVIYSVILNGMAYQGQDQDPILRAKAIVAYMLAASKNTNPERIIMHLKEFLRDESLASEKSTSVKKELVDILSAKTRENCTVRLDSLQADRREGRWTTFIDGTCSFTIIKNFYPLDKQEEEVFSQRQVSPWHQLSFEDVIRKYYATGTSSTI